MALEVSVPFAVACLWVLAQLRLGKTHDLMESFCAVFLAAAVPWASLLRIVNQQSQTGKLDKLIAAAEKPDRAATPRELAGNAAKASTKKSESTPEPKKQGRFEDRFGGEGGSGNIIDFQKKLLERKRRDEELYLPPSHPPAPARALAA